jgi:hypothetical protein
MDNLSYTLSQTLPQPLVHIINYFKPNTWWPARLVPYAYHFLLKNKKQKTHPSDFCEVQTHI